MYGNNSGIRESRFSVDLRHKNNVAASQDFGTIAETDRDRPVVINAGSPRAMQPMHGDNDSSLLLADSCKFSNNLVATGHSPGASAKHSKFN